jgi:type I restriction enzyme S subunit
MSDLPKGWIEADLGSVLTSRMGKTILSPELISEGLPVFSASVGAEPWGYIENRDLVYKRGTIVISARGTIGDIKLPDFEEFVSTQTTIAVTSPREIEPKFVLHQLRCVDWPTFTATTAIPMLTIGKLNQVILRIAPRFEQRRIVAKVDGLTARTARACKELNRIPTLIARYKQRLLALAFSGELTGGTDGWRTAAIGDLADTQLGKMLDKAKNKGEPTRYLRNINVRWYDFQLDDVLDMPMSADERRKFSIVDGDILTCEGGEPGRSAIWNHGPTDLAFQKALIRIRPDLEQLNPSYLVHHLKFLADAQELERHFTGSTIKHLPQRALQGVELPVPPIKVQAEIVRRIESAFGWLDRMAADHAAAARLLPKLDAAILAKAFQGKLVPQDPNDEPAGKLLERVAAQRAENATNPGIQKAKMTKDRIMAAKPVSTRDQLLNDCKNWPPSGATFEDVVTRVSRPYDEMRDALFELLSEARPQIIQAFDPDREIMVFQRAAA